MLLAFDTATPLVTVALHDGTDVVAEASSDRPMKHGEQLAPLIERVLAEAGVARRDLDRRSAVGVGPGPFTGLRVGLVTARTLGFVLEIPVHGLCSLDVVAVEAVDTGAVAGDFLVATDARRKEVYLASYDGSGRRRAGPAVLRPDDAATDLPVAGEGAAALPRRLPARRGPDPAERRLAGPRPGRRAGRGARRPTRSTCAVRTPPSPAAGSRHLAALAARPPKDRDPARRARRRCRRSRTWRTPTSARTRGPSASWSPGWPARCRRRPGGSPSRTARSSGTRWSASWPRSPSSSGSRSRRSSGGPGSRAACSGPWRARRRAEGAERVLLEVRDGQRRRPGVLRGAAATRRSPGAPATTRTAPPPWSSSAISRTDHGGDAAVATRPVGKRSGQVVRRVRDLEPVLGVAAGQVAGLVADVPEDAQLAVGLDLRPRRRLVGRRCRSSSLPNA